MKAMVRTLLAGMVVLAGWAVGSARGQGADAPVVHRVDGDLELRSAARGYLLLPDPRLRCGDWNDGRCHQVFDTAGLVAS